ncbi:MAG: glutamate formimidoyltransferase [Candidatus Limnocylindria bacterium]|nr:glutamate formimidoyltransferase [Candidatus Limnocylindria bacterium]
MSERSPGFVECVPNLSEGRRPEVVDRIAAAVAAVPGATLLDRTSDPDHNRSVITFAGPRPAVAAAALALVAMAIREIDLRTHTGVHPRIGAVDVLPFVPLGDSPMEDCVALAHEVGREIAARHGVPVYFYGRAALRADRERLADVRRPGFEGLGAVIGTTHLPDAGPARVHPTAGAIAVGARPPLIAFNVELDTTDRALARRIAREIRASSGGLPALQALGLPLADPPRVQVSMNLLDHERTGLVAAFDAVASRARAVGVRVIRSELVGLAPAAAVAGVTAERIALDALGPERTIEGRLAALA